MLGPISFAEELVSNAPNLSTIIAPIYQFDIDGAADGGLGSNEFQLLPQTFVLFLGFTTSFFQFRKILRSSVAIRSLDHEGAGRGKCGVFPSASCHLWCGRGLLFGAKPNSQIRRQIASPVSNPNLITGVCFSRDWEISRRRVQSFPIAMASVVCALDRSTTPPSATYYRVALDQQHCASPQHDKDDEGASPNGYNYTL